MLLCIVFVHKLCCFSVCYSPFKAYSYPMAESVPKKYGPFEVLDKSYENADRPLRPFIHKVLEQKEDSVSPEPPFRRYDCSLYENCLNLAAALNWNGFSCSGCCGEIDEKLYWRAQASIRKDSLCHLLPGRLNRPQCSEGTKGAQGVNPRASARKKIKTLRRRATEVERKIAYSSASLGEPLGGSPSHTNPPRIAKK